MSLNTLHIQIYIKVKASTSSRVQSTLNQVEKCIFTIADADIVGQDDDCNL